MIALGIVAMLTALMVFVITPRMDWSAASKPGTLETRIAEIVRERWISIHSFQQLNPLPPSEGNLARGRDQYNRHCAICHGLDGSGRNRLHAVFHPPVARLTGDTQRMSDGEIYFVVSSGIALSGMPAFGAGHPAEEIWKMVLWVRHLPNLSSTERNEIERRTSESTGMR